MSQTIVLVGKLGSGKTKLFNKLTGSNQTVKSGGVSVTREIYKGKEQFDNSFQILDTPGFGAEENKLEHAACILAAVSFIEIYQIFIIVKYERYDLLKIDIKRLIEPFKRYQHGITICISWFDTSQNPKQEEQDNRNQIQKDFLIRNIIFTGINDDDKSIINKFKRILQQSECLNISIFEREIFSCFDLLELSNDQEKQFEADSQKYILSYRLTVQTPILNFLKTLNVDNNQFLPILDNLQDFAKQKLEETISIFQKEHEVEMNNQFEVNSNNQQYHKYISFENKMKIQLTEILYQIILKMSTHPQYIGSQLKACPYCDRIWVKVYGCDKVYCGDSTGNYDPLIVVEPKNQIQFKIQNSQLIVEQNSLQPFSNEEEIRKYLTEEIRNGYFKNVYQVHKLKNENDFFSLVFKEYGNDCFKNWLKLMDRRDFQDFKERLSKQLVQSKDKPKEGTINGVGCGQFFYWEGNYLFSALALYKKAKPLSQEQKLQLSPEIFDVLKSHDKNFQAQMQKSLQEEYQRINNLIVQKFKGMKVVNKVPQQKKTGCITQ